MADIKKEVEAILFSAGRAVKVKELQSLMGLKDPGLITEAVKELQQEYAERESPQMIVEEDEGFKLTVRESFLPLVQRINPHTELSKTMLETLAVITWKQPIFQSDVIKIRTNKAYDHISELERMGFITRQKQGRSFLIRVTQKFLDYFDLPSTDAIKDVFKGFKDVEVAVQKKAGKMQKESGSEMKKDDSEKPESSEEKSAELSEDVELEPYIDVLPEETKPKAGPELEVYEGEPGQEGEEGEEGEEQEGEGPEEGEEEGSEEEAGEEDESAEEKARRLAEQVLAEHGEHEEKEEEESEEERKLHPQLEEFIAKHAEEVTPKPSEEHEIPEEPEDEAADEGEDGEHEEADESEPEEEPESHDETPDEEKERPAEEYPGQFADQADESGDDEDRDEEKK